MASNISHLIIIVFIVVIVIIAITSTNKCHRLSLSLCKNYEHSLTVGKPQGNRAMLQLFVAV